MHDGRAPAAKMFTCQMERGNIRMLLKNGVNRLSQLPNPFAMNNAHAQNATGLALAQIIQHKLFHLARLKRVQIEHAIDWQWNGLFVHPAI